MEHVNKIVVIDAEKRVEASGTHEELLDTSPTYQKLVKNATLAETIYVLIFK